MVKGLSFFLVCKTHCVCAFASHPSKRAPCTRHYHAGLMIAGNYAKFSDFFCASAVCLAPRLPATVC